MNLPVKIACRPSPLALAQVDEIIRELEVKAGIFDHELIRFETAGDRDKTTSLTDSPDDFFTDAIDRALLEGKADIAVHSAKDLPQHLHQRLKIFALTQGLDSKDAWVGRMHWKDLPLRAKVGTSSIFRQKQILGLRPDVTIVNIRGTINERLQLIKESKVEGIVAAACALKRLGLEAEIKDIFSWEGTPLQGRLAVVGRSSDHELENLFNVIDVRQKVFLHCGTHPDLYGRFGKILHWPMIVIKPVLFSEAQQKYLLQAFESADIIVCTSRYAVEHFFRVIARSPRQKHSGVNSATKQSLKEQLGNKIFAVIGDSTLKVLQEHDIQVQMVSREETARGLFQAISQHINLQGKRVLLPRSSLPNPFLKEALVNQGALVTEITVYENIKPAKRDLPSVNIEGVIFTSPSTVKNFLTDYGTIPKSWKIMAKGQVTLKTLQEAGYHHAASLS